MAASASSPCLDQEGPCEKPEAPASSPHSEQEGPSEKPEAAVADNSSARTTEMRVKKICLSLAILFPIVAALVFASLFSFKGETIAQRSKNYVGVCYRSRSREMQCEFGNGIGPHYEKYKDEEKNKGGVFEVVCYMKQFDPVAAIATLKCSTKVWGDYALPPSGNRLAKTGVVLMLEFGNLLSKDFKEGDYVGPLEDIELYAIPNGWVWSTFNYPKSKYEFELPMTAYLLRNGSVEPASNLTFFFKWYSSSLLAWDLSLEQALYGNGPLAASFLVRCTITLNGYFQNYVLALNSFMWMLSVSTAACIFLALLVSQLGPFKATDESTFDKDAMVRWPLLAFAGTLLFALPTMRGLWPMAPSNGTQLDLAIFAQLCIVSSAVLVMTLDTVRVFWRLGQR